MAGYCADFSKSNNAVDAERSGRFPASVVAKKLGVPTEFIRRQKPVEWHHTSSRYNATYYYDLEAAAEFMETAKGKAELAAVRNETADRRKAKGTTWKDITVTWIEWGGTRSHPKATERTEGGCTVVDKGGQMLTIVMSDGTTMRKGKQTRGLKMRDSDGKPLIFWR